MRIERGPDPGPFMKYRDYKPHLQSTFGFRCAYCLSHEDILGRYDAMEIDHFRPRSVPKFKGLTNSWENLYYSCRLCNRHKSCHWPTAQQTARDFRFVDPCQDDPDEHFRLTRDPDTGYRCRLRPQSCPGKYTADKIRLDRKQLRDVWQQLDMHERKHRDLLAKKSEQVGILENDIRRRGVSADANALLADLKREKKSLEAELERIRNEWPFPPE